MIDPNTVPDGIMWILHTHYQDKQKGLPKGVTKVKYSNKRYAPIFTIREGETKVIKKPKCKSPEEAHQYWQWMLCKTATGALDVWQHEDSFSLELANHILNNIVQPVWDDYEAGRESH
ncbi:hypothetical protein [Chromohalobacter israelensis]|uniref:hypothetical protein n=1 Tax=Chromohalobacter israelensis TaxID=141390 RepID=UPI000D71B182|nr:hypothetical protein [Chromohalobacter salexigens]PWW26836.1 hypothetical protein DFO74_1762 [Chromohalobacter salexigens]